MEQNSKKDEIVLEPEKDLSEYLTVGEETARTAGQILLDYVGKFHIHEKGRADLVTEADFASQEKVKEMLLHAFPTHTILGEEKLPETDSVGGKGVYRWIVDPLDGTTNYVHTFPQYCVSIGLEFNRQMQVGIIFAPVTGECFTTMLGRGAWLNGVPIHTSSVQKPEESLAAVGFPPHLDYDNQDLRAFLNALRCTHALRRMGSTALNLAYTACGRLDASWSFHACAWDSAAGSLMVREAGGSVQNVYGKKYKVDDGHFLATANRKLQTAFQNIIHRSFPIPKDWTEIENS